MQVKIQQNKKKFESVINVLSNIVTETDITFSPEEVLIRAVHPSNHCMIIINIKSTFFEIYDIEKIEVYTLDMKKFQSIINIIDEVNMLSTNDSLKINDDKNIISLNYFVGVKEEREKPIYNFKNIIEINTHDFFNTVDKSVSFDDIGMFKCEDKKLFVYFKSHIVNGKLFIQNDDKLTDEKVYIDLKYIQLISEIKNVFEKMVLSYDEEFPLSLVGEDDKLRFEFILANRVGEQNE